MAFFRQRGKGLWALSLALLCVVATASDLAEGPISLNVQQLDTAQPAAPPRPPNYARHARFMRMATSQAASTSSAAPNLNNMHITNAAPLIGPQGNFAGDVASQPAPLPVISPAADLIPPRTTTAFVPSSAYSSQPFNSMSLQTAPGARVLAGSGCVCESDPCDTCEKSDVDKLEEALDKIKDTIVDRSQQLREENIWVRQVLDIIRHYQQKMSQVTDHSKQLKGDIRALFRLKQRYEDAVLRARLEAGRRKQMHNRDEAAFRDLRPSTMVASPVTGVQNPYRFRSLRRGGASAPSSSASSPSDEGNMFMPPTATAQASGLPPLDSVVAAFPPTPQQIENRADTVVSAQLPAQQVDKDTVVFGD